MFQGMSIPAERKEKEAAMRGEDPATKAGETA
jgi:hypothetical protein